MVDYFRDCMDVYFIVSRQSDKKHMKEQEVNQLLSYVTKVRFSLGLLGE